MVAVLLAASCAAAPVAPPAPVMDVRAEVNDLQVVPLELVFCSVRGEKPSEQTVALRNSGATPIELAQLQIVGGDAELFRLGFDPLLPLILNPGAEITAAIGFAPPAGGEPGVRRATLRVRTGPRSQAAPPVDIAGLVIRGHRADQEPPLAQVLETLGFPIDTGGARLRLGITASPIGAEVRAARFRRAQPGAVSLYPVARFSTNERVLYGIYPAGAPARKQPLAAVAPWQGQTLNPDLEPGGRTTFDPGEEPFGVFETIGKRTHHGGDALNSGRHAARVYPLGNRSGGRVRDAYLVAFDEDGDGDYQDCVFVIGNVVPL
jgi:hypothetical protein